MDYGKVRILRGRAGDWEKKKKKLMIRFYLLGNSFAIVLWSAYGAIQFPIYEQTRKKIDSVWPLHHRTANMIRCVSMVFVFFVFFY